MPERPWDTLAESATNSQDVVLAAPYIKLTTLNMLLDLVDSTAKIICITRWDPLDIAIGVSDLECRNAVLSRGGVFNLHPSLHAKYYRFDDTVLVGSANLTGSGLGYSSPSNLEILCPPSDEFNSAEFEQQLLAESREIGDSEFSRWSAIKAIQLPALWPTVSEEQTSTSDWRPHTQDPEHVWFVYTDRGNDIASFDERTLARHDVAAVGLPPGLSRELFNAWVAGQLMASPFVNAVADLQGDEPSPAWAAFAEDWGLSRTAAVRSIQATRAWIATFLHE